MNVLHFEANLISAAHTPHYGHLPNEQEPRSDRPEWEVTALSMTTLSSDFSSIWLLRIIVEYL
jgi:hypothetical protein